jgi:hypothetical protein
VPYAASSRLGTNDHHPHTPLPGAPFLPTGQPPSRLDDVTFGLDPDSMDRSLAAMAKKFLPMGSHCVRIRKYIDVQRRCVSRESAWVGDLL